MRLFIAIQFNVVILTALTKFQEELKAKGVRGRYTSPENLHLTLAFIGEYNNPNIILDAMSSIPFQPFCIHLDGTMGAYGDLYWVGIAKDESLSGYVKKLRRALANERIPYDRKRFSPHITLIRKTVFHSKTEFPIFQPPTGEMQVLSISLMRSERGKHGMIYTEIDRIGE